MAVKRLCGRNSRHLKCLRCKQQIEAALEDNIDYKCPRCGQAHLVDIYGSRVALTAAEHADIRRRHGMTKEAAARRALIEKAEQKKQEAEQYQRWLEDFATNPEWYIENELEIMDEEKAAGVVDYLKSVGYSVTKDEFNQYLVKLED
jgi:DNA-directed RNA polymerase subunit RPC12/RpoP